MGWGQLMANHRRTHASGRRTFLALAAATFTVLAGLPPARAAETARVTEPEPFVFGEIGDLLSAPGDEPAGEEVVEARTETTRTYETDIPGVFATEVSQTPLNYQVGEDWVPIDPTLVPTVDGFENAANEVQIEVADSADAETVAELSLPGASVGFSIEGGEAGEPAVADDTATYENAVEGADIELQSLPTGLKETIIIDSASAPTVYSFPLSLSGVTPRIAASGAVEFVDAGDVVKFVIPPGYVEDSSVSAAGTPALSEDVTYALVDGGQTLEVSLDEAWLTDPARVFPVLVDPTVNVYTDADDTFVANVGSTDRSGYYVLKAGYDGTYKFRSFLHFDMSTFDGMNVLAANLKLVQNGSGSCTASPLDVYQVTESWTGSTTTSWPGPDVSDEVFGTINSGAGHDVGCPYDYASTDLTRLAQLWSEGEENNGISLRSRNENDSDQFKQVGSQESYYAPRIEVLWNDPTGASAPNVPNNAEPDGPMISDTTPTLSADYSDPELDDGYVVFFAYERDSGRFLSGSVSNVVESGASATYTPASPLPNDFRVTVREMAVDDVHEVPSALSPGRDLVYPSVMLTSPSDGDEITSLTTVTAALAPGVTASSVEFLLDYSVVATDTSAPYVVTGIDFSSFDEGPHLLAARLTGGTNPTALSIPLIVGLGGDAALPTDNLSGAPTETEAGSTTAGGCTYKGNADTPHAPGTDVSVHAWWENRGGCSSSQKANVDVYLEEYYSDGRYRMKSVNSKTVYAGTGGSGRRVNVRRLCEDRLPTGWRTAVDVDLIGINDPANIEYPRDGYASSVPCRVYTGWIPLGS